MTTSLNIYGIHAVEQAISNNESIGKVFIQKGLSGPTFKALEAQIRQAQIPTSYVPIEKLNRLTKGNHQGVVAQIAPVTFIHLETMISEAQEKQVAPLFIILDQVSDVRNVGAILRTAACTGVCGVIIPKTGSAPLNEDTVKTSAGGIFEVPIAKVDHIKDAIYFLQASDIQIVAITEKAADLFYQADFTKPTAIIMGSEGPGIMDSVLNLSDAKVKIPMTGNIGSLNVSVACSVCLYEAVRQRQ
jgi:23S rRNA (guanosine2251-2'-O)-methyltransferase